jgi:hypothetical protein
VVFVDGQAEYDIEPIIAHRCKSSAHEMEYLVQWTGYGLNGTHGSQREISPVTGIT